MAETKFIKTSNNTCYQAPPNWSGSSGACFDESTAIANGFTVDTGCTGFNASGICTPVPTPVPVPVAPVPVPAPTPTCSTIIRCHTIWAQVAITQPVCTNGILSNGTVRLLNIIGADSYLFSEGSSYSGNNICTSPAPFIGGNSLTMTFSPPESGQSKTYTVRLFDSNDCSFYQDYTFTITSPVCVNTNRGTFNWDFRFDDWQEIDYIQNTVNWQNDFNIRIVGEGQVVDGLVVDNRGNRFASGTNGGDSLMAISACPTRPSAGYRSFIRFMVSASKIRAAGGAGLLKFHIYATHLPGGTIPANEPGDTFTPRGLRPTPSSTIGGDMAVNGDACLDFRATGTPADSNATPASRPVTSVSQYMGFVWCNLANNTLGYSFL